MAELPAGTVTFLFTDIESSTRFWQEYPEAMPAALKQHHAILQNTIEKNGGYVFQIIGDAFCAVFDRAEMGLQAAVDTMRALKDAYWENIKPIKVRMALHTGPAEVQPGDYTSGEYVSGLTLSQTSRLLSAGHGTQILVSNATAQLLQDYLPEDIVLRDLGTHRLKDLVHPVLIYQVITADFPKEFPALKTLDARPNNLPAETTPLVGRKEELATVDALIADPQNRLISIIGAGGMGKTRLALATAEQQLFSIIAVNGKEAARFPDGVYFIRLAAVKTTEAMLPTLANAVGFQFYEGIDPHQQMLDFFRNKRLLLVFDNYEHLLEGTHLLTEILAAAPKVKALATSRVKLNLQGETLYNLQGMQYPAEGDLDSLDWSKSGEIYTAIELFLQHARRIRPEFRPNTVDLRAISQICQLVEGMPLGVELAAAWMEMLSPAEIAAEIQQSLDFLETERRDAPERHQSMRAVFDYTWNLLSPKERNLLPKLSIFQGGFTAKAAREVVGASLKDLLGLVNKSLLQRSPEGRLDFHELLRQYAAEKLNPEVEIAVRNRHCDYYGRFLQERELDIFGGHQDKVLAEIENIRSFYNWAINHRQYDPLRISHHSFLYLYHLRSWYVEARAFYERAFQTFETDPDSKEKNAYYGLVLGGLGWFQVLTGDNEQGLDLCHQSHAIMHQLGTPVEMAIANIILFAIDERLTQSEQTDLLEENLQIYEETGQVWIRDWTTPYLAGIFSDHGQWDKAEKLYQQSIGYAKEANNLRILGLSNRGLGSLASQKETYPEAKCYYEKALSSARAIDYKLQVSGILDKLAVIALVVGDFHEAKKYGNESLEIAQWSGYPNQVAGSIHSQGMIAYEMGHLSDAEQYYKKALHIYGKLDHPDRGFALCSLGDLAITRGNHSEAIAHYLTALEIGLQSDSTSMEWLINFGLACVAEYLQKIGVFGTAVELAALTLTQSRTEVYMRYRCRNLLSDLEKEMPAETFFEARKKGQARVLRETAEEIVRFLKSIKV